MKSDSEMTVKNVLVELCVQIKQRFDLRPSCLLAKLCILNPKIAQDITKSTKSVIDIPVQFPQVVCEADLDQLQDEWRVFRRAENPNRRSKYTRQGTGMPFKTSRMVFAKHDFLTCLHFSVTLQSYRILLQQLSGFSRKLTA